MGFATQCGKRVTTQIAGCHTALIERRMRMQGHDGGPIGRADVDDFETRGSRPPRMFPISDAVAAYASSTDVSMRCYAAVLS